MPSLSASEIEHYRSGRLGAGAAPSRNAAKKKPRLRMAAHIRHRAFLVFDLNNMTTLSTTSDGSLELTMSNARAKALLARSIRPSSVAVRGLYTQPKTWGVYKIEPPNRGPATKRIRFGNHPVRQQELEGEFGAAVLVTLFPKRVLAEELARLLNHGAQVW